VFCLMFDTWCVVFVRWICLLYLIKISSVLVSALGVLFGQSIDTSWEETGFHIASRARYVIGV